MRLKNGLGVVLGVVLAGNAFGAKIYVTTETAGIGTGACSLQEAIYSSILHDTLDGGMHGIAIDATDQGNPPDHFVTTGCVMGDGNDTIVLPTKGTLQMQSTLQPYGYVDGDAYNPYGPTATPLIISTITIEGNGATLQWDANAAGNVRLFAIGGAVSIKTPNGTAGGTGSLTLRNVYVKGFHVKGGDGFDGGGGGLGAGGAIYLQNGALTVENSTFDGNQAAGGNVQGDTAFGGGGGMGGHGGHLHVGVHGGGGGGARGDGGDAISAGGGGGGTVFSGGVADVGGPGGYRCGGNGASDGDGGDGSCEGGGGGGGSGGGSDGFFAGSGGNGAYGGGGGGGANDGGNGGFGGGGGSGNNNGGNGGFGGGAGLGGINQAVNGGSNGAPGHFGGGAGGFSGGGGGALGGAIFNDGGTVTVRNSTFTNNAVSRGVGGGGNAGDAGGAIFSHDGDLTIVNSTFSGNQSTGSGGAVVAYMDPTDSDAFINFTLENTIIANNGANECFFTGNVHAQGTHNLIMSNGSGSQPFGACADPSVTDDPKLLALHDNGGYTQTMAIPFGSVAMGAADSATSIATDQRGANRPQAGGFDIGAYELCRIKVGAIFQTAPCNEMAQQDPPIILTVLASTGGATDPAAGSYPEVSNTVVPLHASANSGYYFTGWTGNVATATSASTTIIMDAPHTVGANFQLHDFSLSLSPTTLAIPLGGVSSTAVTATALGNFADKVLLSAAGTPTGVGTSFGTNPVAPVNGTPASSIFTLTVGPSARPQVFTETFNGKATGLAGTLSRSASLNVTLVATAAAVVNVINQQQSLGCIDGSGIVQSLNAKMNTYQKLASGGHVQGASNVLGAFQYEVQAQIGHHVVTSCTDTVTGTAFSPGETLIADAQSLQATLGAKVKGAPIVGLVIGTNDAGTAGRTVNLLRGNAVIATTSTDAVGFYYLDSSSLTPGAQYNVNVTIPAGYRASFPANQAFTWSGDAVRLADFVLN